jgi:4-hydroxy-tetrahydrodipicolinate synthase
MGEASTLSAAERRLVVETVVAASDGPVTAGVSAGTPGEAIRYATDAAAAGAHALMLLPPLGYAADEGELVAFYGAVAGATALPVMAYNNPAASGGTDMPPALIARIAEAVEPVVAIKECSGDARRIAELLGLDAGLEVLVGGDDWALEGFGAGATGWVSGVAVVAPRECVELFEACRDHDIERAREVYARLLPLARLDMTPKLVQFFKAGIDAIGRVGGPTRPPRLPLDDADRATLGAALRALGAPQPA